MEHYDEVIFSKDTFVNNDHVQLMQMYYPGVKDDPLDAGPTSIHSEYWHDGMQAVSIDRIRYMTTQDFDTIQKFEVASYLGAESWQGKSLAGGVDEISEMLKRRAEFDQLSDAVAAVSDRHDEVVGYIVATDGDDDDIDFDNVGVAILDEDMEPIAEVEIGQAVEDDYDPPMEDVYYSETFEATPYSNWFGACLTADGRCFEATMSDCRALGGRFQGPGTSCGGYQQPLMMGAEYELWDRDANCGQYIEVLKNIQEELGNDNEHASYQDFYEMVEYEVGKVDLHDWSVQKEAETFESEGTNTQGKGLLIAITVGVMTGVLTTIFGNVASEMWLDRLREDPELHTTPDDLNGPE
jgi:hypothetical protein